MTVFADASALIAMMAQEDDALSLAQCLQHEHDRLYSAIVAWETMPGLTYAYHWTIEQSQTHVARFLSALNVRIVPIGDQELREAISAYARFGKGRHPARLSMGDCYAYACAKTNRAQLLFKGDDFGRTDIEPALRPL